VDDPRESPALELLELLRHKGAEVAYSDPHVPRLSDPRRGIDLASEPLSEELLAGQDCVLVVTDHSAFDWEWVVANSPLVVDTRNATRAVREHRDRIVKA
jgi:UDP-N-acetyl-D-glucosamine dehydrogenase